MYPEIDKTVCLECGLCEAECPNGVYENRNGIITVTSECECDGESCACCVDSCPVGAIKLA